MPELRIRRARASDNPNPSKPRQKQPASRRRRNTTAVRNNRGRPKKEDAIGGVDEKREALKAPPFELEKGQKSEGPMDEAGSGGRSCDKAGGAEEGSTAPVPERVSPM